MTRSQTRLQEARGFLKDLGSPETLQASASWAVEEGPPPQPHPHHRMTERLGDWPLGVHRLCQLDGQCHPVNSKFERKSQKGMKEKMRSFTKSKHHSSQ